MDNTKQAFPNPAEVCKSRGWVVETPLRRDYPDSPTITIRYIGKESVVTEAEDGHLTMWRSGHVDTFVELTEVKPKPVVTVEKVSGGHSIKMDGHNLIMALSYTNANEVMAKDKLANITRNAAEAVKAAIESELGTPTENVEVEQFAQMPYRGTQNGMGVWIIKASDPGAFIEITSSFKIDCIFGEPEINEIVSRKAREIAAELNALHHAKAKQPRTD